MCKAQKVEFGQVAAAVAASTLLAGVRTQAPRQERQQRREQWIRHARGGVEARQRSALGRSQPGGWDGVFAWAPGPHGTPSWRERIARSGGRGKGEALTVSLSSLLLFSQSANALTYDQLQGLTYLQVKGSGIANTCPVLEAGSTNLKVR